MLKLFFDNFLTIKFNFYNILNFIVKKIEKNFIYLIHYIFVITVAILAQACLDWIVLSTTFSDQKWFGRV